MKPNYRKELLELTDHVLQHLAALDEQMRQPSTVERGKRIANLANLLDMRNDSAMRYGLGMSFPGIAKRKKQTEEALGILKPQAQEAEKL